jgi:rhodanese-related sulfurtransferase
MSSRAPEIDTDQLAHELTGDVTLIDVRETSEFVAGHVPGAASVPMGQLAAWLPRIVKGRPVYVICASGNRSAAMTDLLVAAGCDAYSVAGGTAAWALAGRPVETGVSTSR